MPQDAGGVADALGKAAGGGVEQDAGGLKSRGGQHDYFGAGLAMIPGCAFDVVNAGRLAVLVHEQVADYGVADQSEATGPGRGRKRHCGAVEVGRRVASALTLIAVVTRRTPVVRNGEVGDAIRHHAPPEFSFNNLLGEQRPAGEVHGRQEPSVRHLLQALSRTAHADEAFNLVVVRFQLL